MCQIIDTGHDFGHQIENDPSFRKILPLIYTCSLFPEHVPGLLARLQQLQIVPVAKNKEESEANESDSLGTKTFRWIEEVSMDRKARNLADPKAFQENRLVPDQKTTNGYIEPIIKSAGAVPEFETKVSHRFESTRPVKKGIEEKQSKLDRPQSELKEAIADKTQFEETEKIESILCIYDQALHKFRAKQYHPLGALHRTHTLCASGSCSNQAVFEKDGRKGEFCRRHTSSARDVGCLDDVARLGNSDLGPLFCARHTCWAPGCCRRCSKSGGQFCLKHMWLREDGDALMELFDFHESFNSVDVKSEERESRLKRAKGQTEKRPRAQNSREDHDEPKSSKKKGQMEDVETVDSKRGNVDVWYLTP